MSKAQTLRSAFFQAVKAQSGLLEGKHRQQAAGEGKRDVLAFISFAIDHAYDKITQTRENGI